MNRITLEKSQSKQPGTWNPVSDSAVGQWKANVTCPDCKTTMSLKRHAVASNGDVSPSLVCPRDGCSFHEFVNLNGWSYGDISQ